MVKRAVLQDTGTARFVGNNIGIYNRNLKKILNCQIWKKMRKQKKK